MRLNKLTLKNFKGLSSFTLEPQGEDIKVFGDNATGKTTLYDGFLWLLFGKDSQNRKDFNIKTLDENSQPISGLDHEVEAEFSLDSGNLTLKKVYKEKWTKKKGQAQATFTGHTIDHFIDGVPVKQKDYDARISDLVDEEVFRLLTDPRHFNRLHWQKRREILLQVCGDVSQQEVINSNEQLQKLPEILGNRDTEEHKKVIQARKSEINKQLDQIPARVDEVTQGLPDVSSLDRKIIEQEISTLNEQIKTKQQELQQLESGDISEKQKQLGKLDADNQEIERKVRAEIDQQIQQKQREKAQAEVVADEARGKISRLSRDLESLKDTVDNLELKSQNLRSRWHEVNAREFTFEQSDTCPTCGQNLPQEQLEEARQKALEKFNSEKAQELEEITAEGKIMRKKIDQEKDNIKTCEEAKKQEEEKLQHYTDQIEKLDREIQDLQDQVESKVADATSEKTKEIERLKAEIKDATSNKSGEINKITEEIHNLEDHKQQLQENLAALDHHAQGNQRIQELKEQEKELAREFEQLEEELHLLDEFTKTKVKLLDEKINSKFKHARFKMFNTLINGGIEDTCETLYQGVPYPDLNNGAQLNIGLDIIQTLSEHYGFSTPIFVDNAEAVTELIPVDAQVIKLIVSEPDKEPRVEQKQKEEVA